MIKNQTILRCRGIFLIISMFILFQGCSKAQEEEAQPASNISSVKVDENAEVEEDRLYYFLYETLPTENVEIEAEEITFSENNANDKLKAVFVVDDADLGLTSEGSFTIELNF